MYKCERCGEYFENTCKGMGDRGYDPDYDGIFECPRCGGEPIELKECRVCGDYITDGTDTYFGMCPGCELQIRKDVKRKLYDFCKKLEDSEFDILEDMVSQVELRYVIQDFKKEMEEE